MLELKDPPNLEKRQWLTVVVPFDPERDSFFSVSAELENHYTDFKVSPNYYEAHRCRLIQGVEHYEFYMSRIVGTQDACEKSI